ncbi:M56 family metallopeptidase [Flavobacterium microcysteis]|uniref:Peptidase M56 n=1 Tax=Flavobacterium microcysteis TaxID=2596891 RepID=A0A501QFG9_9FLAO|nr:M56 family metallopeptidase [Flavobacterium microcysteis]TPD71122.1 peptidase M56 [Flavobacterium microcysteis]
MESFIFYFAKTSALLAIFFLAYYFLLRKETFFTANRWFLLAGIATSLFLPKVILVKTVWVEPAVTARYTPIETAKAPIAFEAIPNAGEELVSPSFTEAENSVITTEPLVVQEPAFKINWLYVIIGVYLIGMLFFLGKFIRDFRALQKIIRNQTVELHEGFKFLDTDKIQSPFSFFSYIVYNSKRFRKEELENILEHEKVHSSQKHSVDMIISQLFCVVFWFNPFAWLHKKAIAQNLEFIADSIALKAVPDRIIYQKTLLKVSAPHQCIPITNHFFQSLIKKRIVMLNTDQSKKRNSWKYAIVLPLLTVFMLQFQVETVAQEKEDEQVQAQQRSNYEVRVDKNSTDDYLTAQSKIFKNNHGIDLKFSKVKRNSDKEIVAIKTTYKDKNGNSGDSYLKGKEPIQPFLLSREDDKVVVSNVPAVYGSFNTPTVYGKYKNNSSPVALTYKTGMPVMPTPPTPPVMPNIPTLPNAPTFPQLPAPPTPPTTPYDENSAAWKKFDEQIKKFEAEMNSKEGEIAKFEEAMEKFAAQVEATYTKDVEKQMEEFEKKMEVFEQQMELYAKQFEEQMEKDARNR